MNINEKMALQLRDNVALAISAIAEVQGLLVYVSARVSNVAFETMLLERRLEEMLQGVDK